MAIGVGVLLWNWCC